MCRLFGIQSQPFFTASLISPSIHARFSVMRRPSLLFFLHSLRRNSTVFNPRGLQISQKITFRIVMEILKRSLCISSFKTLHLKLLSSFLLSWFFRQRSVRYRTYNNIIQIEAQAASLDFWNERPFCPNGRILYHVNYLIYSYPLGCDPEPFIRFIYEYRQTVYYFRPFRRR